MRSDPDDISASPSKICEEDALFHLRSMITESIYDFEHQTLLLAYPYSKNRLGFHSSKPNLRKIDILTWSTVAGPVRRQKYNRRLKNSMESSSLSGLWYVDKNRTVAHSPTKSKSLSHANS